MKIAATASYKAVPSMLMVAPIGMTKRVTRGSTWFFSSKHFSATGRVAELLQDTKHIASFSFSLKMTQVIFFRESTDLDEVAKAVAKASERLPT